MGIKEFVFEKASGSYLVSIGFRSRLQVTIGDYRCLARLRVELDKYHTRDRLVGGHDFHGVAFWHGAALSLNNREQG